VELKATDEFPWTPGAFSRKAIAAKLPIPNGLDTFTEYPLHRLYRQVPLKTLGPTFLTTMLVQFINVRTFTKNFRTGKNQT
jgi:hypothetical protein